MQVVAHSEDVNTRGVSAEKSRRRYANKPAYVLNIATEHNI